LISAKTVRCAPIILALIEALNPAVRIMTLYC
jgi:hypothetical protein